MLIRSRRWLGKCPFESATWRSLVTLTWVISLECGGRKTDYKVQKALLRKEKKIVSIDSSFEEFCSKGNRKMRWNLKADMGSGKILILSCFKREYKALVYECQCPTAVQERGESCWSFTPELLRGDGTLCTSADGDLWEEQLLYRNNTRFNKLIVSNC